MHKRVAYCITHMLTCLLLQGQNSYASVEADKGENNVDDREVQPAQAV